MSSRLYEINYNKEQWEVRGNRDIGYTLINTKTLESYCISGDVVGIEQITDDEFLVFRILSYDEWEPGDKCQIARVQLKDSKATRMYSKDFFGHFKFLTKDIIIFENDALLYYISENKECDKLNHLFSENNSLYDCRICKKRTIGYIYNNSKDYPDYILMEYDINSIFFKIGAYLQVPIDVNSLLPIMPVYSSLRPGKLYLAPSQTLGELVEKECYYASVLGNFLFDFYHIKNNKKKPDEILAMIKEEIKIE